MSMEEEIQKLYEATEKLRKNIITRDEYDEIKKLMFQFENVSDSNKVDSGNRISQAQDPGLKKEIPLLYEANNTYSTIHLHRIKAAGVCVRGIYRCILQQIVVGFIYGFINGYYGTLPQNDNPYNNSSTFNIIDVTHYHNLLNIALIVTEIILIIQLLSQLSKLSKNLINVDIPFKASKSI